MKHLDNIVGPVRRVTRKSMEALTATGRFKCDMYMRDYFEDKFNKSAQLEQAAEMSYEEFRKWLEEYKLIDNISNRMRFLLWPNCSKQQTTHSWLLVIWRLVTGNHEDQVEKNRDFIN
jgi:hypothetical protein